jgi:hypothetical protein
LARSPRPEAGIHCVIEEATLYLLDGRRQFLDGSVLDGLVPKGDAPLAFGKGRFQRLELGLRVSHQRYTTTLISVESVADPANVLTQRTSK